MSLDLVDLVDIVDLVDLVDPVDLVDLVDPVDPVDLVDLRQPSATGGGEDVRKLILQIHHFDSRSFWCYPPSYR